jgi:hypothetical protein
LLTRAGARPPIFGSNQFQQKHLFASLKPSATVDSQHKIRSRNALSFKVMEQTNQTRLDAPSDAPNYSVTVDEAAALYEQAGIPRTIRRVQKYCARGDLDCKKIETEFGEKYYITLTSIERHIAQISDAQAAAGRAPTRLDASEHPLQTKEIPQEEPVAPPSAQARPDAAGRNFQDLYIQQLEKENSFLREQSVVLLERVKETNVLTQGLQRLLLPLLRSPEKSEDDKSTTN